MTRPEAVAHLVAAYRATKPSPYAALVLANRHRDFTIDECRAALSQVLTECVASMVLLEAAKTFNPDPVALRLELLSELSDDQLEVMYRAGALDDLELDMGGESWPPAVGGPP